MKKRIHIIMVAIVIISIGIWGLFYTRPLTIENRYPQFDFSECIQIKGFYNDGSSVEDISFTIKQGNPHFDELLKVLRSTAFKTEIKNIFPKGTRTHSYKEGDFNWYITIQLSDDMIGINNFFGDLILRYHGEEVRCSVDGQEQWVKNIMDMIQ